MIDQELAQSLKAWPFKEALQIIKKNGGLQNFKTPSKGYILLETGYGPSGLPHIGTFGEVVRTSMVKNAFSSIIDCPTKLITFSDDMDGLRKVPENVPNKEMLEKFIGKPLTSIPDPFGKFESFGHHNNAKLRSFLDEFNFDYEFVSSTEKYQNGDFNETILSIFENYLKILDIILPTLRAERKETYSPFLPISENSGEVLQVKIEEYKMDSKTIIYKDPSLDKLVETEVINGKCKLQWKVDWAMRWMSFDVDYEMCGKDLTESVDLGSKICRALNKKPPTNLIYEMFLDEKGEKISKSVGNGISVDEWLRYASPESLALYMFQKPKSAKKLHFDVIPKTVDDYLSHYNSYSSLEANKQYDNPIWHIHSGKPKEFKSEINFNTLTNLVNVSNSKDKKVIWSFINKYDDKINADNNPEFDRLIDFALNYYEDFILPKKKFLEIDSSNHEVFVDIINILENEVTENSSSEDIQTLLYEVGKKHKFENLKDFFKMVYQVMLGQDQGPRLGSFFKLFGIRETIDYLKKLIDK